MRTIFTSMAAILILLSCGKVEAQTFGGITMTAVTNYLAVINSTNMYSTGNGSGTNVATNTFSVIPPSKTITLFYTNNETFIGYMYLQVPANLMTNIPNSQWTNLIFLGMITNQFPNSTGWWQTNTPALPVALPFPLVLGCSLGSNNVYGLGVSNSIFVP